MAGFVASARPLREASPPMAVMVGVASSRRYAAYARCTGAAVSEGTRLLLRVPRLAPR